MGIRGQLMWFLCFICLLLLVLFWFLCTQLLEPLYTTHIQKQLTEQADAIVQKLDDAIADGQTLSYWGFGSQLYVNSQFFNQLGSEIYENGGMSSFCVDISDVTLRQIFKVENLSYCNLHRTRPTDENSELPSYSTARAMRQLCRETGSCVRKINPPTPSGTVELMVGRTTSDGSYTVLVTTSLMHVSEAGEVMSTVLPLAAALIFAFSMSAAWLFSEWFTKPLRQLSGAARQVAQGDYAVQVETNRRDELGDLAQEFNHMAKEVQHAAQMQRDLLVFLASNKGIALSREKILQKVWNYDYLSLIHIYRLQGGGSAASAGRCRPAQNPAAAPCGCPSGEPDPHHRRHRLCTPGYHPGGDFERSRAQRARYCRGHAVP